MKKLIFGAVLFSSIAVAQLSGLTTKAIDVIKSNSGTNIVLTPSGKVELTYLTGDLALKTSATGEIEESTTTATELDFVSGVTSAIQTQIDSKQSNLPLSVDGDLLYWNTTETALAIGTLNQLLSVDGAGLPSWIDPPSNSPLTTKGDVYTYDTDNQRLAVGTANQILSVDLAEATGLKWIDPPSTSPTTTEGDLILRDASVDVRLPIGTVDQLLTSDGTTAAWQDAPVSTTLTTKGDIQTYDTANQRLAVGVDGSFLVADSSEATGLKYSTSLSGTLNPVTDWAVFTMDIESTGTNPTKATTTIVDTAKWRRVGSDMEIEFLYYHTDNTGATTGTGNYLFKLPSGMLIDSSLVTFSPAGDITGSIVGSGWVSDGTVASNAGAQEPNHITVYDASSLLMANYVGSSRVTVLVGDTHATLAGSIVQYKITAKVPIAGWTSGIEAALEPKVLCEVIATNNDADSISISTEDIPWKTTVKDNCGLWSNAGNTGSNTSDAFTPTRDMLVDVTGFVALTAVDNMIQVFEDGLDIDIGCSDRTSTNRKLMACQIPMIKDSVYTFRFRANTTNLSDVDHRIHIAEKTLSPIIAGTFENINSTDLCQVFGAGNIGDTITSDTENIPFIEIKDNCNIYDGQTITIPRDGRFSIDGMVRVNGNTSGRIAFYVNGAIRRYGSIDVISNRGKKFALTDDFLKDDTIEIRITSGVVIVNTTIDHYISLSEQPDFEAVVANLLTNDDAVTSPDTEQRKSRLCSFTIDASFDECSNIIGDCVTTTSCENTAVGQMDVAFNTGYWDGINYRCTGTGIDSNVSLRNNSADKSAILQRLRSRITDSGASANASYEVICHGVAP